jgi:hypothetical protein
VIPYCQRRHYLRHITSPRDLTDLASVSLPFSRSSEWLNLNIQDKTDERPDYQKTFHAGMSTSGDVTANVHYVLRPLPPFGAPAYQYQSAEQVRSIYGSVFTESIALGGLVAHGMRALDIDLDTAPAKALLNEWRATLGNEPITVDAFWVESNSNYLIRQRPEGGQG